MKGLFYHFHLEFFHLDENCEPEPSCFFCDSLYWSPNSSALTMNNSGYSATLLEIDRRERRAASCFWRRCGALFRWSWSSCEARRIVQILRPRNGKWRHSASKRAAHSVRLDSWTNAKEIQTGAKWVPHQNLSCYCAKVIFLHKISESNSLILAPRQLDHGRWKPFDLGDWTSMKLISWLELRKARFSTKSNRIFFTTTRYEKIKMQFDWPF